MCKVGQRCAAASSQGCGDSRIYEVRKNNREYRRDLAKAVRERGDHDLAKRIMKAKFVAMPELTRAAGLSPDEVSEAYLPGLVKTHHISPEDQQLIKDVTASIKPSKEEDDAIRPVPSGEDINDLAPEAYASMLFRIDRDLEVMKDELYGEGISEERRTELLHKMSLFRRDRDKLAVAASRADAHLGYEWDQAKEDQYQAEIAQVKAIVEGENPATAVGEPGPSRFLNALTSQKEFTENDVEGSGSVDDVEFHQAKADILEGLASEASGLDLADPKMRGDMRSALIARQAAANAGYAKNPTSLAQGQAEAYHDAIAAFDEAMEVSTTERLLTDPAQMLAAPEALKDIPSEELAKAWERFSHIPTSESTQAREVLAKIAQERTEAAKSEAEKTASPTEKENAPSTAEDSGSKSSKKVGPAKKPEPSPEADTGEIADGAELIEKESPVKDEGDRGESDASSGSGLRDAPPMPVGFNAYESEGVLVVENTKTGARWTVVTAEGETVIKGRNGRPIRSGSASWDLVISAAKAFHASTT